MPKEGEVIHKKLKISIHHNKYQIFVFVFLRWENQFKSIVGTGGLVAYENYQDAMGWYERTDVENPMISVNEVDVALFFCLFTVWILKTMFSKYTQN